MRQLTHCLPIIEAKNTLSPNYQLARGRVRGNIVPPQRYDDTDLIFYALNVVEGLRDPNLKNFIEVVKRKDIQIRLMTVNDEINSLMKNHTQEYVRLPNKQQVVGCKCVFKKNEGILGIKEPMFKSRLVAKAFTQVNENDYNEIFSPMIKYCSLRVFMEIINQYNLELNQMNFKTTILRGDLKETIHMERLKGFVENKTKVLLVE